ncbi:MAG: hypothetical protein ACRD8W_02390 [Nitrososphaeraceae archaeon]
MRKGYGNDDYDDENSHINNSEKDNDSNSADDISDSNSSRGSAARWIGTLDDGTNAFMLWLESMNKQHQPNDSLHISIILREFIKDKLTILYDKNLEFEINVEIKEGVPFCRYCNLYDCSHVGFTISLEQMCEDHCGYQELSVYDIVDN